MVLNKIILCRPVYFTIGYTDRVVKYLSLFTIYRHELYETGVSVHIIEPGFFATPLLTSLNRETMTRYLRERQRKQPRETAETYDHYVNRGIINTLIIIGPVNQKKIGVKLQLHL